MSSSQRDDHHDDDFRAQVGNEGHWGTSNKQWVRVSRGQIGWIRVSSLRCPNVLDDEIMTAIAQRFHAVMMLHRPPKTAFSWGNGQTIIREISSVKNIQP